MSRLKYNLIANFFGKVWSAIMTLALIPFYIKFIGIEAYGLVGFSTTILAFSGLLDMGLTNTLNRELAIFSTQQGKEQESRDLVRTLEVIYWGVSVVICVIIVAVSPLLANSWLKTQQLSKESIQIAIALMGVSIACQFPISFYSGGLLGLQRQVFLNGITIVMYTLRGIGMILVLWLVSPTIQAFFIWQALVSLLQTLVTAVFLWRSLPSYSGRPRFRKELWLGIRRFASGMAGIALVSLILMQADKVILSKMLTLEQFGYYSLSGTLASGTNVVTASIFAAVFPRFTELISEGSEKKIIESYHKSCQLLAVFVLPISVTLTLFSKDILLIWTGDSIIAEKAHLIVSLLTIGTSLQGLMNGPYALQLAYGWTKLAFFTNIVAISVFIPSLFWLTSHYGAVGAASVWVILNSSYVLIGIRFMHFRLLKGELMKWYYQDVFKPLFGALLIGSIIFFGARHYQSPLNIWLIAITVLLVFLGSSLSTEVTSRQIKSFLSKKLLVLYKK